LDRQSRARARSMSRSRLCPGHVQVMAMAMVKVRGACGGGGAAASTSQSQSVHDGGRWRPYRAHGTWHSTWDMGDSRQSTLDSRQEWLQITPCTVRRHYHYPHYNHRLCHPSSAAKESASESDCSTLSCPVFRYTRKERASWHMHRMLLPSGSGPLLPCRLPAACYLPPCRQTRALSASLLSPPRRQPEETEAEDETRHVVSLQPPAHGDKRTTAPHRTEHTTEGRQHPTAPPRATNGVAVVIPMPAIDDRPVAHRAAIGAV
jgi:hypothetical protein